MVLDIYIKKREDIFVAQLTKSNQIIICGSYMCAADHDICFKYKISSEKVRTQYRIAFYLTIGDFNHLDLCKDESELKMC